MTESIHQPLSKRIETSLGGIALLLLLLGCLVVLLPFSSALMWAMILAYSLYPLQRCFTRWFRGSRTLAACLVSLTLTLLLAGPIVLIGFSLAEDGKELAKASREWFMEAPEEAPGWIKAVPVLGDSVSEYWSAIATDRDRWIEQLDKAVIPQTKTPEITGKPASSDLTAVDSASGNEMEKTDSPHVVRLLGQFLSWARTWLISIGLAVGQGLTQIIVSAFLAFFMLRDAPVLAERLSVAVDRLAGGRGQHLLKVAGDTVRGVIYGILGTALIQALLAAIGFAIAGVPGAILLGVLTFFFAVVPFGPPLVWLPAALWLYTQGSTGWAVFILIWGALGISSVDNILRPYLISQGSKMPFALIFCGVIGGALAFGLVGVFIGPTLLAVAFRLIDEWSIRPGFADATISELPDPSGSARPTHGSESFGAG
jgi:predicted PurR-regulated permease PerM